MKKSLTKDLVKALRKDEGLYISWKANIAMAFFDEMGRSKVRKPRREVLLAIANNAAVNFLNLLIKDNMLK